MSRTIFASAAVGLVLLSLAVVVLRTSSMVTPLSPAASQSQDQTITICHRTGSADNPWVFMTVDVTTWSEHQAQGDFRASSLAECPALATPASAPAVAAVLAEGPVAQVQTPTTIADARPVAAATATPTPVDTVEVAGAEVREGFSVQGLIWDGDRVCGIQGESAGGSSMREQARIVIGADGRRSPVARLVDAPTYNSRPALTFGCYSYWSGIVLDGVELYPREGQGIVAEVTNDGLAYAAVGWRRDAFDEIRADVDGQL